MIAPVYCRLFIQLPVLCYNHRASLEFNQAQPLNHEQCVYDMILSVADTEYEFVRDVLLPYLEIECKQTVYFPARDMTPDCPEIAMCEEHILKSRNIIIVLSDGYKNDNLCQVMQLQHIILPLLYEDKRLDHQLLFILYDKDATLPVITRWNHNVSKLDWCTYSSQEAKLSSINKWLGTGKL